MDQKITYFDIREESARGALPTLVGRAHELQRLTRIISRSMNSNILLVGPGGIGKTALVHGWMALLARQEAFAKHALVQLETDHMHAFDEDERSALSISALPKSVVFIDDFGREVHRNSSLLHRFFRAYKPHIRGRRVHLVLTMHPHEHAWLMEEHPSLAQMFETILLKNQSSFELSRILTKALPRLNAVHRCIVPDSAVMEIVTIAAHYPSLGQMPRAGISVLDEALSDGASRGERVLSHEAIARVVETRTGVPSSRIGKDDMGLILDIESSLRERVIDQDGAVRTIAASLRRAKLGLRDPRKPLGSFLLLGPSGVGKTETAKSVAELLFGGTDLPAQTANFIRFDMSEFQQEHSAQRLIGAPPGYVGYDQGGALTNALKKSPHSLILLDEIEKAHPKVFDIFLQVLDEGRITSGQSETIDARHSILMATSNIGVREILEACEEGADIDSEHFVREHMMPALAQTFRLEFLNRFDAILIFRPLSKDSLMKIAQLEIQKIEKRLAKHRVHFEIDASVMEAHIRAIHDPRFGARPVKRFIEETCETLVVDSLLQDAV